MSVATIPEVPACPVCLSSYDTLLHRPWALGCGHCICQRCWLQWRGPKQCPTDRKPFPESAPYVDYDMLHAVELITEMIQSRLQGDGELAQAGPVEKTGPQVRGGVMALLCRHLRLDTLSEEEIGLYEFLQHLLLRNPNMRSLLRSATPGFVLMVVLGSWRCLWTALLVAAPTVITTAAWVDSEGSSAAGSHGTSNDGRNKPSKMFGAACIIAIVPSTLSVMLMLWQKMLLQHLALTVLMTCTALFGLERLWQKLIGAPQVGWWPLKNTNMQTWKPLILTLMAVLALPSYSNLLFDFVLGKSFSAEPDTFPYALVGPVEALGQLGLAMIPSAVLFIMQDMLRKQRNESDLADGVLLKMAVFVGTACSVNFATANYMFMLIQSFSTVYWYDYCVTGRFLDTLIHSGFAEVKVDHLSKMLSALTQMNIILWTLQVPPFCSIMRCSLFTSWFFPISRLIQMGLYLWPLSAVLHAAAAIHVSTHVTLYERWTLNPELSSDTRSELSALGSKVAVSCVPLILAIASFMGADLAWWIWFSLAWILASAEVASLIHARVQAIGQMQNQLEQQRQLLDTYVQRVSADEGIGLEQAGDPISPDTTAAIAAAANLLQSRISAAGSPPTQNPPSSGDDGLLGGMATRLTSLTSRRVGAQRRGREANASSGTGTPEVGVASLLLPGTSQHSGAGTGTPEVGVASLFLPASSQHSGADTGTPDVGVASLFLPGTIQHSGAETGTQEVEVASLFLPGTSQHSVSGTGTPEVGVASQGSSVVSQQSGSAGGAQSARISSQRSHRKLDEQVGNRGVRYVQIGGPGERRRLVRLENSGITNVRTSLAESSESQDLDVPDTNDSVGESSSASLVSWARSVRSPEDSDDDYPRSIAEPQCKRLAAGGRDGSLVPSPGGRGTLQGVFGSGEQSMPQLMAPEVVVAVEPPLSPSQNPASSEPPMGVEAEGTLAPVHTAVDLSPDGSEANTSQSLAATMPRPPPSPPPGPGPPPVGSEANASLSLASTEPLGGIETTTSQSPCAAEAPLGTEAKASQSGTGPESTTPSLASTVEPVAPSDVLRAWTQNLTDALILRKSAEAQGSHTQP